MKLSDPAGETRALVWLWASLSITLVGGGRNRFVCRMTAVLIRNRFAYKGVCAACFSLYLKLMFWGHVETINSEEPTVAALSDYGGAIIHFS